MRLLIIGMARWGKDSLAAIITEMEGLEAYSSSMLAVELFLFNKLAHKYDYKDYSECFADRVNHRAEWHDLIAEYNADDPSRLAKELLDRADIYVGMRSLRELQSCRDQKLFDSVIWVDASKRLPHEGEDSCELTLADADIIIDNNGTEEDLRENAKVLISYLKGEYKDELLPVSLRFLRSE